jgi:hypothetical protein
VIHTTERNVTVAKAKPKAKEKKTVKGNAFTRMWKSKDGKDVKKGDVVKTQDGEVEGVVTGRHTRPKDRAPMLLVLNEATAPAARKGKGKQARNTSLPASEVTIIKKGGGGK